METLHHQRIQEKLVEQNEAAVKQQTATTTTATATASTSSQPPSATSSPSHEFSFTISLHHSSSSTTPQPPPDPDKKTHDKSFSASPFAIDLSPADDIFFHGHLLPLHLLSHLPVSPRSSTNSLDSFTLPIKELLDDDQQKKPSKNSSKSNFCNDIDIDIEDKINNPIHDQINKGKRNKPRSNFSLFGLTKWRKGCESREGEEEEEEKEKDKKKIRLDLTQVLKRYIKMVRPLFFKKREDLQIRKQSYSFSGNLSSRKSKQQLIRGRRGEFSAPASMRTSPTNSGLLLATTTSNVSSSSTSDSTMEELQAAIQAAIAHCKNSIAVEDKLKR